MKPKRRYRERSHMGCEDPRAVAYESRFPERCCLRARFSRGGKWTARPAHRMTPLKRRNRLSVEPADTTEQRGGTMIVTP